MVAIHDICQFIKTHEQLKTFCNLNKTNNETFILQNNRSYKDEIWYTVSTCIKNSNAFSPKVAQNRIIPVQVLGLQIQFQQTYINNKTHFWVADNKSKV